MFIYCSKLIDTFFRTGFFVFSNIFYFFASVGVSGFHMYILLHSGPFPPPDNLSGSALIKKSRQIQSQLNWTCRLCKTICNCNIWLPVQSVYCFLRITGTCFTFFPTFLQCNAKTISLVRSKNPISFFQLIPHLQCCNPINCCFIFLPHFGQILLLAPIIFTSLNGNL